MGKINEFKGRLTRWQLEMTGKEVSLSFDGMVYAGKVIGVNDTNLLLIEVKNGKNT